MIRPATDADFVKIAELMSPGDTEPVTAEDLLEYRGRFPADGNLQYLVLDLPEVGIVSFGRSLRRPNEPIGRRALTFSTHPAFRNRGYGQAILNALQTPELTTLRVEVRDNDPASLAFAEKRGFRIAHHTSESVLDLDEFDERGFTELILRAGNHGVRFFSFAETAMNEEALRKIWAVNVETGADQPGANPTKMGFEEWRDSVSKAQWFASEGQLLAADASDNWVGLGAVGELSPGRFYNLFTGVRREYRGKGIATALKALGILYARAQGGRSIRTHNHSDNAPMLAINRRFGYRALPGWHALEKEISLAT